MSNKVAHHQCSSIIGDLKSQLQILQKEATPQKTLDSQQDYQDSFEKEPEVDLEAIQTKRIDYEKERKRAGRRATLRAEKEKEALLDKMSKKPTGQVINEFNAKSKAHRITQHSKAHLKEHQNIVINPEQSQGSEVFRLPRIQSTTQLSAVDQGKNRANDSLNQQVQQEHRMKRGIMQEESVNLYSQDRQNSVNRLKDRMHEYEKNKNRYSFQLNGKKEKHSGMALISEENHENNHK